MEPVPRGYEIQSWSKELLPYHLDYWISVASSMDAPRFVYIDGFANPGDLKENQDCAAMIAYKTALRHQSIAVKCPEIFILLADADENNCYALLELLKKNKEGHSGLRNAEKVRVMVIHAEFTHAMEWVLSDGFAFCDSSSEAIFQPPTPERFISRDTPTLVYTEMPHQDYVIPVPLIQKFHRLAGIGGMLIVDFAEHVLNQPKDGNVLFVDGDGSELGQVVVFIGQDDVLQTYIILF